MSNDLEYWLDMSIQGFKVNKCLIEGFKKTSFNVFDPESFIFNIPKTKKVTSLFSPTIAFGLLYIPQYDRDFLSYLL